MSDKEHKTERGALLAGLEYRCIAPGDWEVEGYRVTRMSHCRPWSWVVTRGVYVYHGAPNHVTSERNFTDALRWIASERT